MTLSHSLPSSDPPRLLIVFEGVDGSGKSTQINRLSARLDSMGILSLPTREPGGTPLGQKLREILLAPEIAVHPEAQLFLFLADRVQHAEEVLRPALEKGMIVLSDRFADATTAYQAFGAGLSREFVATLNKVALGGLSPDLTILLDLPVPELEARLTSRDIGRTRFETLGRDYFERVRRGYLEIARVHADRTFVLDATFSPDRLESLIFSELERRFPETFVR